MGSSNCSQLLHVSPFGLGAENVYYLKVQKHCRAKIALFSLYDTKQVRPACISTSALFLGRYWHFFSSSPQGKCIMDDYLAVSPFSVATVVATFFWFGQLETGSTAALFSVLESN